MTHALHLPREDHIGPNEHKDFEDYKRCKGILFTQCKLGIANIDDKWFEDVFRFATCKVETFGFSEKADLRAVDVEHVSRPGYLGMKYKVEGLMDFDVEKPPLQRCHILPLPFPQNICGLCKIPVLYCLPGLSYLR